MVNEKTPHGLQGQRPNASLRPSRSAKTSLSLLANNIIRNSSFELRTSLLLSSAIPLREGATVASSAAWPAAKSFAFWSRVQANKHTLCISLKRMQKVNSSIEKSVLFFGIFLCLRFRFGLRAERLAKHIWQRYNGAIHFAGLFLAQKCHEILLVKASIWLVYVDVYSCSQTAAICCCALSLQLVVRFRPQLVAIENDAKMIVGDAGVRFPHTNSELYLADCSCF